MPVEMVYLDENPFVKVKDEERPKGRFWIVPMRTGGDKVFYGTGVAYLGGLAYGGVYGTIRGLQRAPNNLWKVRWNSILNQTTRYGPWAAMAWAMLDNALEEIRETKDYYNHVGAAFLSGALFKCTAGLRPAVLTGGILSGVVLAYGAVDKLWNQTKNIQFETHAKA